MTREREELLIVRFVGNPGQRPHFRIRELARCESAVDEWKLREPPRHPHVLAG